MLATIPGLENVQMMRAGYAIEYDAIVPTQLWPTLETKKSQTCLLQAKLTEHPVMKKPQDKELWQESMQVEKRLERRSDSEPF